MKTIIYALRFYHRLIGPKIFILYGLVFGAALFEGLGVSLFLPLIEGLNSENKLAVFVKGAFSALGIGDSLTNLLLVLILFFTFRSAFMVCQATYGAKLISQLLRQLRQALVNDLFRLKYESFIRMKSGDINNALVVEFANLVFAFNMLSSFLISIIFAAIYMALPLWLNPQAMVMIAIFAVPTFLVMRVVNKKTKILSAEHTKQSAGMQQQLLQTLQNYKYLRATSSEESFLSRLDKANGKTAHIFTRQTLYGAIAEYGFDPIVIVMLSSFIYYSSVIKGQSIIESAFVLYLLYSAAKRMIGMQVSLRKLLGSWGSLLKFEEIHNFLTKNKESAQNSGKTVTKVGKISLQNVAFRYPSAPTDALSGLNLEIQPGEFVAFVGKSGAGKTSLVNLIAALLGPSTGRILIDDTNLSDLNLESFRRSIGYVGQESSIFNDSILNNITLWKKPDQKLLESALHLARLDEFIASTPEGVNTFLEEAGANLSGGQKQRIGIARELYKNPSLMLFDEATSALDPNTENEVKQTINSLKEKKTVILITHKLNLAENADKIYVLSEGKIIQEGTFQDLIKAEGWFQLMWKIQGQI